MILKMIPILGLISTFSASAYAQEITRKELSRSDLTGTNMEVILMETEVPPGATFERHTHPGEEAYYVLEGTMVQFPGKAPAMRETGLAGINKRDAPHSGYKNVSDKPLKVINVYIVDKDKPLSSPAP